MKKRFAFLGLAMLVAGLSFSLADTGGKGTGPVNPASVSATEFSIIPNRIWNSNLSSQLDGTDSYLLQDFEGTTFPPAGWTVVFTGTQYWTRFAGASGYGVGVASAKFDFWSASTGTTQSLVTPTMGASVAGDSVKFDHAYATYTGGENDQMAIDYSTDGGTNWTQLVLLNGGNSGELVTAPGQGTVFTPTAAQWATKRYALPLGTNKLRFRTISAFGNNLYVDNITIGSPLANDVGTQSVDITNPTGIGSQIPQATVKNFGTATQTFPVTMLISPGGYSSTQNVTSLASNGTQQVSFGSWNPTAGSYNVTVFTNLGTDGDRSNDTVRATIQVINAINGNWAPLAAFPAGAVGGAPNYWWPDSGKAFIAGGSGTTVLTNCYFYDPVANTYATKASLPIGRAYGKLVRVRDSLYLVGSINSGFTTVDGNLYRYHPRTDTWVTKSATSSPLIQEMGACVWRDSLIITVGGSTTGFTGPVNSVRVYNPFNDTWTVLAAPFPATAMGLFAECIGNEIIVLGGVITGPAISNIAYRGTIIPGSPISINWRPTTNPYGEGVYRGATAVWNGYMMFGPTQKGASPPFGKLYGIKIADSTVTNFLPDLAPPLGNIPNMAVRMTTDSVYLYTFGGYNGSAVVATCSRYGFRNPVAPGFFDNFESYTAGQRLACQDSVRWTTWSNLPCNTTEDPLVSSAFAYSGTKSVVIVQNNDLVRKHANDTTGVHSISFRFYIPSGKAGYFNTLATYSLPSTFNWGMEAYFDSAASGNNGRLFAGSSTAATFSYAHNAWQTAKVLVNLNLDSARVYINNSPIRAWRWTAGSSGAGSPRRLAANDFFGATAWDQMYMDDYDYSPNADWNPVGVSEEHGQIPEAFALMQNYPNPFNPSTTIRFGLPQQATVTLKVYNLLGQEVATLADGIQNAGSFEATWNGRNAGGAQVSSGVYFYRLEARPADGTSSFVSLKKMLLLK